MSKKVAFIFPGQGAQYPGMGRDFFEHFPAARAIFERADAFLGRPFSELIFNGPSEELTQTKNSQLAIFITSLAIFRAVEDQLDRPVVCAGLSLGEYTALVAAGVVSFEDGLALVQARGSFMQEAAESHPGTMQVVLGLSPEVVETVVTPLNGVWVANLNAPGQVVIAGKLEALEIAAPLLKEAGARRVAPLEVSGAFHSGLMETAREKLSPLIQSVPLAKGYAEVVMNVPGSFVSASEEIRNNLCNQVTHTTHWQKAIEAIEAKGIDLFIEMGPGKTLAGMNRRIGVKAPTLSIEKVEDIQLEKIDATS
ncbi:MAG: Malonyl CoA-acyl carrier protein transacylase [Chlamydiae bacterium]|nr:Malonyl CoA-acyl carrier protein transacylase [Chlamydiota bacterium]